MINLNRLLGITAFSFSLLSLLMIVNIFNILLDYGIPSSINCQSWNSWYCNNHPKIYKIFFFPSEYHKKKLNNIDPYLELLKIFLTTAAGTTAGFKLLVTRDERLKNQLSEATALLNDNKINVRIQGIFLLKRILSISPENKQFIVDLLTLFIREQSPLTSNIDNDSTNITNDIQTALSELLEINSKNLERNLSSSNLKKGNFSFSDLRRIDFTNSNLEGSFFKKADLRQANFEAAYLKRTNLSETTLNEAIFKYAHLENANFSSNNLHLKDVKFQYAYLQGAKFEGTIFDKNVAFDDAILDGAKFINATLKKVSFKRSKLQKAKFFGADLKGADFEGADLEGADFEGAKNIIPERIKTAKNWELAKYNPEFRRQLGLSSEE